MGGDSRKKWIFISFIIVYFQYFFVRINSAALCSQEDCSTNCCNCTFGSGIDGNFVPSLKQLLCNGTCPVGFYMSSYDPDEVNCMCMYSTTTINPSVNNRNTTSLENSTTSTTLLSSTTATSERNFFCQECNDICLSCEGSATNCTQCRKGFELKEGGNCTQITTVSNNSQQPLATIIGASVGGGVALIIVVTAIIVCCVCRRKRRDTSRMSGILQGRAEGGEKRDDDVTDSPSPHPIYENVERPNELGNQIQEQGDKILRYARDPTMMDKKKEPKQADPTRSSSYYENSATIRRQDNIQDINGVSGENAELEQLGQAPLPPSEGQKKSKKSLKSRMSKKINKLRGNVSTKTSPISDQEAQEDHYLPMGPMNSRPDLPVNKETSQDSQEVYEEMEDKLHQPSTLFIQENYENVEDVPSVSAPPPPPLVEQEDYENIKDRFPVPERARTGQKSKGRMPDPPAEAKLSQTSPASGDDKLSKDYINVEKYRRSGPEISKKDDMTSQEAQEELEDYENVKQLSKKK